MLEVREGMTGEAGRDAGLKEAGAKTDLNREGTDGKE